MFRLLALSTVAVLLAAAPAAPAPRVKTKEKPRPYHAIDLGTRLVYDVRGADLTSEVTAVEEKDGETVVTVSETFLRQTTVTKVVISVKGLSRLERGHRKEDAWSPYLRFPVKEGDSWEYDKPRAGVGGISGKFTVEKVEEVEVPAGKFKAVRLEEVVTRRGVRRLKTPEKYTGWYDPDLGLVKLIGPDGFTRVLKSVTRPGKKD